MTNKTDLTQDNYLRKGWKENYGIWLIVGGLHPPFTGINWIFPVFLVVSLPMLILLFVSMLMVYGKDFGLTIEFLHFIDFLFILIVVVFSFYFQQNKVQSVYRTLGYEFYDYQNTLDKETQKEVINIKMNSKKNKNMYIKIFKSTVFISYLFVGYIRPIVRVWQGEHLVNQEDYIQRQIIIPVWFPCDKNNLLTTVLMCLCQVVLCVLCLGQVMSLNLFFLATCEESSAQCSIVAATMKYTIRRAKSLPLPLDQAIKVCIAHSVRHHQVIISTVKDINEIAFLPALTYVFGSTIMICMSAFLFISDQVTLNVKVCFVFIFVTELFGVFIYCYYGEKLKTLSTDIYHQFYNGDWMEEMTTMKSYMLIIQAQAAKGLTISAGGMLMLNLETYSNVLSSAFSYFNIIRAAN